jgi:hypothetical protein
VQGSASPTCERQSGKSRVISIRLKSGHVLMFLKAPQSSVAITLPSLGLHYDFSEVEDLLSSLEWTLDQISFE